MILALVELNFVFKTHEFAIDPSPREAVLDQFLHFFFELALATPNDRSEHHDAVFGGERHYALHDLRRGLPGDRASTFGAMRYANGGKQQPQVVIDFCDRSDR